MEPTQCSETSAFNTQMPGRYPEDNLLLLQHSESLKTRIDLSYLYIIITNHYYMYLIVETHFVLCLLLSNDKFYIHSGGSLE